MPSLIEFQGSFTDQQKTSIQNDVLTPLLQNKTDVSKVVVSSPEKDIISVQIFYKNGQTSTYRYYFDYRTQKWTVIIYSNIPLKF